MMKYYLAIILFLTIARLLVVDLLNTVEKGIKLTGLSFKTLDTIGFKQCAKICVQYSACLSFNYHRKTYTCYLNQGNKTFGTGTVENDPDYEYSDVTDWKNMFSYLYSERNCVVSDRLIVLRDKFTCINTCIDSSLSAMSANMVMSSSTGRTTLYSCEENFSGYGDNRVQCLANGTWSMLNFACYPKEPKNSIVSSTNTNSATYTCKEGYIGRGINTIYFQNGNWTSLNLICFAVKDDWILVFRAMSKIGMPVLAFWENNGTGHENNYAIEKGCVSENYTDICSTHYRSILLDEWSELDVREAMVVLYKNGIPVANTTFNSIGSNRDDWFSMNNVLTSTWTDVYPGQINNVFTLNHTNPSVSRSFIMSYAYDGCPGDILWMMIAESNGVCVFDNVSPYPSFLYSPQTTKVIFQTGFAEADVFAVYIRVNNFN